MISAILSLETPTIDQYSSQAQIMIARSGSRPRRMTSQSDLMLTARFTKFLREISRSKYHKLALFYLVSPQAFSVLPQNIKSFFTKFSAHNRALTILKTAWTASSRSFHAFDAVVARSRQYLRFLLTF